jgi:uncharacterized protein
MPDSTAPDADATLAVVDWRRRTHDLYRDVRTLATTDRAAAHARWREGRDSLFARHPASPLLPEHRAEFTGLAVAAYDERYRFEVSIRPATGPVQSFVAPTGTDGEVPYERLGSVALPTPDGVVELAVWRLASYGGGLFVPVRDGTAGRTTYGGGRYLLDTVKGADLGPGTAAGTVVIDLNYSYNPSCAYDPHWACPLAPAGNTTAVPLPVGEQHRGPWVLDP